MSVHPLDFPAWSALTGRQAHLALIEGAARRYAPAFGVFAGVEDKCAGSLADLRALVAAHGDVALLETEPPTNVAGLAAVSQDLGVQMVAESLTARRRLEVSMVRLTDQDGPEMLALAALTEPGPFFERTHELGDFFGVKIDGRLVAMAGERMKPDGFTEVSGVCTHPDHRGQGYAGALMHLVSSRILDRGERPFLHAYASNRLAISLYEKLGYRLRREILMTRLSYDEPA